MPMTRSFNIGTDKQLGEDPNHAGYYLHVGAPGTDGNISLVRVSWIVPAMTQCGWWGGKNAAFWVGMQGENNKQTLEQIGTSSDCGWFWSHHYYAWYEMYPEQNSAITIPYPVSPGDLMNGIVQNQGLVSHSWRQFWMGHNGDIEARYSTNKRLAPDMVEYMRKAGYRNVSVVCLFVCYIFLPKGRRRNVCRSILGPKSESF